jgi:uncharacterized protein YkwD
MRILSRLRKFIRKALGYNHPLKKTKRPQHSHIHVNSINKVILGMVNKERRKRHLHPVIFSQHLENHAKRWSHHMAHQKRLSHSGKILENACMVPNKGSPVTITRNMFYCWRKSAPHWNWMMNPSITKAGFGYTVRGKFAYGAYAFE